MQKIRIFIVDDEKAVRTGLELIINSYEDMEVVGTAANGQIAIEKLREEKPDIVLVDIQMPVMNGIECISHIREIYENLPILILTTFNETDYIVRGLAMGANGYLIKGLDFDMLIQSIRDVYHGRFILPSDIGVKLSQYLIQQKHMMSERPLEDFHFPVDKFSKKEQVILVYLQTRMLLKEIADQCSLTEGTLRNYLSKIYDKLDVNNRHDAVKAIQRFVISK